MSGRSWIRQMLFSAFLMPMVVCSTAFFINTTIDANTHIVSNN